ncbi:MAG: DUF2892 domain-containing protein [Pseudomonadota bacterium]
MTTNMGKIDRAARLVAAVFLIFIAFATGFAAAGFLHWLAIGVAIIFALTAFVGTCPLYSVAGFKTCRDA